MYWGYLDTPQSSDVLVEESEQVWRDTTSQKKKPKHLSSKPGLVLDIFRNEFQE